uniref:Putative ovule protein n=1 Tax=Solanum chacoense TaxID=4108 RepID=A0A0V0H6D5_SOLCH
MVAFGLLQLFFQLSYDVLVFLFLLDPSRMSPNVAGSRNHDRYPGTTFPYFAPQPFHLAKKLYSQTRSSEYQCYQRQNLAGCQIQIYSYHHLVGFLEL